MNSTFFTASFLVAIPFVAAASSACGNSEKAQPSESQKERKSSRSADTSAGARAVGPAAASASAAFLAKPASAVGARSEPAPMAENDPTEPAPEAPAPGAPAPDAPEAIEDAAPASVPVASECSAACDHRKACSITEDAEQCATACKAIRPAFGGTLANYASGDCSRVQAEEPLYQNAIRCAKGCDRRVQCLQATDRDGCVSDCSMAGLKPEHLDEYGAATCEWISEHEPQHQQLRQMIHTCKRLLECNVPGTMQGCLLLAKKNLDGKAYGVDKLASLEKESCDVLQKTAYIEPPPQASGGGSAGGGGVAAGGQRWAPGWFGSWTDTRGNKVYHRPPGPGAF